MKYLQETHQISPGHFFLAQFPGVLGQLPERKNRPGIIIAFFSLYFNECNFAGTKTLQRTRTRDEEG